MPLHHKQNIYNPDLIQSVLLATFQERFIQAPEVFEAMELCKQPDTDYNVPIIDYVHTESELEP